MNKLFLLPLLVLALALAGCESVRNDVSERFSSPTYHTKVVSADQHKAYAAAREALSSIGFNFEKGGAAQGKIKAIGPMQPRVQGPGTASQMYVDIKLLTAIEGGTTIEVLFSELVEEDFNKRPGQGNITPVRESPLYEVYFRHIDEALARAAAGK